MCQHFSRQYFRILLTLSLFCGGEYIISNKTVAHFNLLFGPSICLAPYGFRSLVTNSFATYRKGLNVPKNKQYGF